MILFTLHNGIYARNLLKETKSILSKAKSSSFSLPSIDKIRALDRFIRKLKKEGIWDRVDDLWWGAYNDTSLANFSSIDLKRPFRPNLLYGSTSTYNSTGWKGSGLTTGGISTFYDYDTLFTGKAYVLGNSNVTAVVADTIGASTVSEFLISSAGTNGLDTFYAFNTVAQRQNSSNNSAFDLSSAADLSGIGFKSFSKVGDNAVLYNKGVQYLRTSPTNSLPPNELVLLKDSTRFSKLGLSMFSIGGSNIGSEVAYRQIINEFLVDVGLTAYA